MHERHCNSVASAGAIAEHEATTYGVQRNSILNESKFFNVVDGMAPDIMHDILEGVLPLTIMMLLKYCICRKKFFKIETFNSRLTSFCYGQIEVTNKPTPFKQTGFSTASETTIKQSGKEFV